MHEQCVVAVYPSRVEAEQAFRAATAAGISTDNIRISSADMEHQAADESLQPGMWDWLFGSHVPEKDRSEYRTHLAEGRTALSILMDGEASPARIEAVEEILERFRPVDVRVVEGEMGGAAAAAFRAGRPAATTGSNVGSNVGVAASSDEEVIPLPREELRISTRPSERVRHVRTYVVEEPVEKDVVLHDEEVVIERRPATRTLTGGEHFLSASGEPLQREYEIHERHEEPVVEKMTRADEEIVVRKQAKQHTERVRDTVRLTRADVVEPSTEVSSSSTQHGVRLSSTRRDDRVID